MRFVTFDDGAGARAGVLAPAGDRVLDLAHPSVAGGLCGAEPQVLALIDAGLERVVAALRPETAPEAAWRPRAAVRLLAPLPRPRRIAAVAYNYRDAIAERGLDLPPEPVLFEKHPETVVGPDALVVLPPGIGGVTYEAELAAVIGRPARDVPVADALDFVAGYFAFNDVSASEIIRAERSFDRGKNFPTFGPSGPWLASADEIPDPQALSVRMSVSGVVRQASTTAQMLFGVAELIAFLSARGDGLKVGDVIATGTPAGVAPAQVPPTWIRPGDSLTVEVEGLGVLMNPVVEGSPAS